MGDYTIIGAGAIGGIVGVALKEAGHIVRFVEANRDHVAAVRRNGLKLTGYREARIEAPIAAPDEIDWPLKCVLLAVKSRHTLDALEPVAARLAPHGYVVSLQNGLEEYKIAELVGAKRTIGAFLTFGGHYRAPGEIVYGGPGSFRIGEIDGSITERLLKLRDALSALQPVEVTDNIFGYLWSKIALGAIYFATAATDSDVTDLYAVPEYRELFGRLAGEVVAVAEAKGVKMESFDGFDPAVFRIGAPRDEKAIAATWAGQNEYWNRHEGKRTGVWRDLRIHRRKTEIDRFVGSVIEFARERNIATPGIERLVAVINEIEDGGRVQALDNLDAIAAAYR